MIGDYSLQIRQSGFAERMGIRVSGSGPRTLVLSNGFGTTSAVWDGLLGFLEGFGRVVRFDWPIDPGHFDTTRYSSLDGYAEDLLAVVTATEAAPAILIGHSMSGMIGMLAGKCAPHLFERMVMLSPSPCYRRQPGFEARLDEGQVQNLLSDMAGNYVDWVATFAPTAVGPEAGTDGVAQFTQGLLAMRPDVALSMAITIWNSDLRDQLAGFAVPTTIIQPVDDPAVPVSVAQYLADRWPNAEVRLIDVPGHLPHLTHPRVVREVLEGILDDGSAHEGPV